MIQRALTILLILAAGACATPAPDRTAASTKSDPVIVGMTASGEYLSRDLLPNKSESWSGLHYADTASAYGTLRLAEATHNAALIERVAERYRRISSSGLPNTRNHVDVSVYGALPLYLARLRNDKAALAEGVAYADGQWRETTSDGLTTQARYWIDDVWMISALQLQAWRATHEKRFLDRTALMARLYIARLQQPNGLFHHGENAPFFWGRGNGWVAAGLAETLSDLPKNHPDYPVIAAGYRKMMAALLRYQAEDGMWRQLIDHPEAWKETSSTAMFGYAMALGVHRGILRDPAYSTASVKAWRALSSYVGPDGRIAEVCVGTGKSTDTAYYLARPRVTGDLHGQAALLWFASEMARSRR